MKSTIKSHQFPSPVNTHNIQWLFQERRHISLRRFLLIGACEVIPGKALSTGTSLTLPRWGGDFMVYGDAPGSISWWFHEDLMSYYCHSMVKYWGLMSDYMVGDDHSDYVVISYQFHSG